MGSVGEDTRRKGSIYVLSDFAPHCLLGICGPAIFEHFLGLKLGLVAEGGAEPKHGGLVLGPEEIVLLELSVAEGDEGAVEGGRGNEGRLRYDGGVACVEGQQE